MSEHAYHMNQGFDSLAAELLYAHIDICPAEELAFYERRIRANGGPALDLACGTGRHLIPLLKRGLDVHGADASADALQFIRQEAEESQLKLQLYHQRMEELDLPHQYGTIYIPNGSFQVISDRQQAFTTLERLWRHLTPGGQLLIELSTLEEATSLDYPRDAEHPAHWGPKSRQWAEGHITTTVWTETLDHFEQTLTEKRRYELHIDGQVVHSEIHTLHLRWYVKYEFIMMLERVGFEEISVYGDYTEHPATKETKLVVYEAHHPRS